MNDVEFLQRLERELTTGRQWSDVRGVLASGADPALAPNQLLVFPVPPDDGSRAGVPALAVTVEAVVVPDRQFPELPRHSELDRLQQAAALVAGLHERMLTDRRAADENWPGGSRYQPFGGLSGWWSYLGLCSEVLGRMGPPQDDWADAAGACCERLWEATCRRRGPLSTEDIEGLIRSALSPER